MDRIEKLLEQVRQVIEYLRSPKINEWLKSDDCSKEEKAKWRKLMVDFLVLEGKLENEELQILVEKFDKLEPEFDEGISLLKREIQDMEEFAKAMETLGKVLGLIGKVVAVAAAPSAISATSLLKAKSAFGPKMFLSKESKAMSAESSAEEKTAIAPLEEVLYRVELTPAKLIVTVDAELDRPVEVIFRKG